MSVLLETSLGDVVIDLFTKDRPRASLNFLKLCKLKMYNYCLFHNVQRNFIIQTGDIDQQGGSSVFKVLYGEQAKLFEKEDVPKMKHTEKLTVSMVNDGNGYHGSQFLITTVENADTLDNLHTVFGTVAEGAEIIDQINEAYCDEKGRPYQDIRINHTIILHDPFDDPDTLPVPPRSPSPPPFVLESDRLAVGEAVNKLAGHSTEEVLEYIEEKELKANTQMLEIIGDIPDADMKPPENVLFVCKLNPVTTSDDLEIIFSRFGTIESCEVIRDWKTGDSLCYAFIEFEDVTACEAAYFKMDNVLIDERRIHVDFSQSVSKLYWNRNTKNQMKYSDQRDTGRGPNKYRGNVKPRRDDRNPRSERVESESKSRFDQGRGQHPDYKPRRDNESRSHRNYPRDRRSDHRSDSRRDDNFRSRRDDNYSRSRSDRDTWSRKDQHRESDKRENQRRSRSEREDRDRSHRENRRDVNYRDIEERRGDRPRKHSRDEVRKENYRKDSKQYESDSSSEREQRKENPRRKDDEHVKTKKTIRNSSEEKQDKKKKLSSSSSESSSSSAEEQMKRKKKKDGKLKKQEKVVGADKKNKSKGVESKEEKRKAKELQAEIAKLQSKIKKMKEEDELDIKETVRKQKKKKHKV